MTPTSPTDSRGATAGLHRRVWTLAGPIILANLSVPLLGAVDTAMAGHLPGARHMGAVDIGAVIFSFLFWGFGFLRMGTTGLVAQAHGARDADEVRAVVGRALLLAAALGLLLVAAQWPLKRAALFAFHASPEVEALTAVYFSIRIWGAPATLANYCLIGWFVGLQRTRIALVLQVCLNGSNILLDLFFVLVLGKGVAGLAAATVIAESLTMVVGLVILAGWLRRVGGHWSRERILDGARLKRLFTVNRDIAIRTLCLIFAFGVFSNQGAQMGDTTLAANAALRQLQLFLAFGLDGFAHAAEALVGSAFGARDRDGLRTAVRACTQWAAGIAVVYSAFYAAFGMAIVDLLTDLPAVRALARDYLVWMVASPVVSVWSFMLDGIFIGVTFTREMRNGMILSLATYLAALWLLLPVLGNHGLWLAMMIFMAARGVTLGIWYPRIERAAADPAFST